MTKLDQLKLVRERLDRAIEAEIRRTERATPKPDAEELLNHIAQGMVEGVVRILTARPQEKAAAAPPGKIHLVRTNRTNHQRVARHRSAAPIDNDGTPKPPAC
jgi:hypothetical protein